MESTFEKYYTDEDGYWGDYGNGVAVLLEPSESYLEKHPKVEIEEKVIPDVWDEMAAAYKEGVNSI